MNKTLVYLPSLDWKFLTSYPQQLFSRFASNGWKVFYCNNTQRKDIYAEKLNNNLTIIHDLRRFIGECMSSHIIFDVKFTSVPQYVTKFSQLKGRINIFALLDHFPHWQIAEEAAFKGSDIVITVSDYLYETRQKLGHKYFYVVKNGAPESYINHICKEPDVLKNLKRPIIGLIGSIGGWVDTSLLKKVADRYTTIFIGVELDKKCPPNVLKLGYIRNDLLVDYFGSIDVGLIPFRITGNHEEITKASCPIKLFEYMASGVPCVATKWSETDLYPGIVFPSANNDEFLANINKAIKVDKNRFSIKAKEEARKHTWEVRYIEIMNIIDTYCKDNNIRRFT